ncbi:MAG TPA: hypothetical protein VG796_17650 [Verrucomicrobiales bacterium]|jgi:hypothetical protein|nr:hypothetical protein [Verrucomicrobiales bacterium]
MISFATFGPGAGQRLKLQPGRVRLTQHWLQAGQLAGPGQIPEAGLDLKADGVVVFSATMKPGIQDKFQPGRPEFITGLWKGNVMEWFLGNPGNGRYLEIHVAPGGQWWSCVFTGVRIPETAEGRPLPLSVIHHRRDKTGKRWEATVQVPSSVLCKLLQAPSFMQLRTNLCATAYPVTGRPMYFSFAELPGPKPNFHQPDAWLEMMQ